VAGPSSLVEPERGLAQDAPWRGLASSSRSSGSTSARASLAKQGSGVRLVPLIGGLLVGGAVADRLAARAGVRGTAALGFALLATGLALGATTSVASGDARAIAWIALSGLGLGLVLPTTIDTALGAVSDQSSGVSSGVLQALRMAGGAFGAAILRAIIDGTYRNQLEHATSPTLARTARDSAVTGIDAATSAHSPALREAVRHAFVSGMNTTLWVSAALMAADAVVALVFRPRADAQPVVAQPEESRDQIAA
jgi:hypothetical protein